VEIKRGALTLPGQKYEQYIPLLSPARHLLPVVSWLSSLHFLCSFENCTLNFLRVLSKIHRERFCVKFACLRSNLEKSFDSSPATGQGL
jgi:hypothetical protein